MDVLGAVRHPERVGLPKGEGIDGRRCPAAARCTVAIAHGGGLTRNAELDGAAEATACVSFHWVSFEVGDASVRAELFPYLSETPPFLAETLPFLADRAAPCSLARTPRPTLRTSRTPNGSADMALRAHPTSP